MQNDAVTEREAPMLILSSIVPSFMLLVSCSRELLDNGVIQEMYPVPGLQTSPAGRRRFPVGCPRVYSQLALSSLGTSAPEYDTIIGASPVSGYFENVQIRLAWSAGFRAPTHSLMAVMREIYLDANVRTVLV